jgi:hypothetical protein
MAFKNVIQQEIEQAQKMVTDRADLFAKKNPGFQQRKQRVMTVAPTADFIQDGVMASPGGFLIKEPT